MNQTTFNYSEETLEFIPCNLCGGKKEYILSRKTKKGRPATTRMCARCGLIYISPRMTKEGYNRYYADFYRKDRGVMKDKEEPDEHSNFESALRFGRALGKNLRRFISDGLTVDVGSSTGGILKGLKDEVKNIEMLGIEPSRDEAQYANEHGVKTLNILFEDFKEHGGKVGTVSQVLCVQSLNHLLDPKAFFEWAHEVLKPGGHLILAVKNFRHQARGSGFVSAGVQIDHPFMFTPETLSLFMESSGFRIVYLDVDEAKSEVELMRQYREGISTHHIRIVGEKASDKKAIPEKAPYLASLRVAFWGPYLKLYYILRYSHRLGRIRKILKIG